MPNFDIFPSNAKANLFGVEVTHDKLDPAIYALKQHILLIGQPRATGSTLTDNTPTAISSLSELEQKAGRGSELALMGRAIFLNAPSIPVSVSAIAEPSSATAGEGTITVSGTATESGSIFIYVAGRRFIVDVADGDTNSDVATAIKDKLDEDEDLPVSASVSSDEVTLTARWKGVSGNGISISYNDNDGDTSVGGITLTASATSGGTGTPDVSTSIGAIDEDDDYTVIVLPTVTDAIFDEAEGIEDNRWGPQVNKPFVCVGAVGGSQTDVDTLLDNRNSFVSIVVGSQDSPSLVSEVGAAVGGRIAQQWGRDPAQQLHTQELVGIYPPAKSDRWTWTQRNNSLDAGGSTLKVVSGIYVIEQIRNTLLTNTAGANVSESDKYVNSVLTVGAITHDLRQYFINQYSDAKLSSDGVVQPLGNKIITPNTMKGILINRYADIYIANGWCENLEGFKDSITVERNSTNPNRLDVGFQLYIIGNLRVLAIKLGFNFVS